MLTSIALVAIVVSARQSADLALYASFFLLGIGWGGFIPFQEVVWATYFGRRYLGAARSAGMPFALGLGATAPFATAFYYDRVGNYDGALLAVAVLALVAIVLITFVRRPERAERDSGLELARSG